MAESAVFSLACNILSTVTSPTFKKAYEKGVSIWKAKDELAKLKVTIETIQEILLDAEKKQESSVPVKDWIKRLKGVLYDAEDLFDEVATHDLLKQQIIKGSNKCFLKKVRVSCSKLNPIISRNSIGKKVKAIRESLQDISTNMTQFEFVRCQHEEPVFGMRRGQDPGWFVDAKNVIGRDNDKKAILEMLFDESDRAELDVPIVISIVGIGGMGKTTLAQLVYSDEKVVMNFKKRWFACISDTSEEKEVIGKIFQSISGENYSTSNVGQLQTEIKDSVAGKKFLLVLDDVWDDNHARWQKRMSLLGGAAIGSKVIVTTRSPLVAKAVGSLRTHDLDGLLENESWSLFKRVAFTPEKENDLRWTNLGREIVKKCANVPLAITSIGSLLFEKNSIQEWESFKDEKLPRLGQSHEDDIMPVLKLSYDHLPSTLKQCFAYCSLFPKDYNFNKVELIYPWIAQGYVKENNEDVGHSHFMYLLRRGFFQEAKKDAYGEITSCKMHDLIHDLAQHVAGEESIMLTASSNASDCAKHVSIEDFKIDDSWAIPVPMLSVNGLRSFMLLNGSICNPNPLDQVFLNFNRLRALWLVGLEMENVPSSIGELKHLRYLDLSESKFKSLPNTLTNLLNLLVLGIRKCEHLRALPEDFRKLINLRCLIIEGCNSLTHMPDGIGEMSCLQYLSDFKVGKTAIGVKEEVAKRSGLIELARLQHQLRGKLSIWFENGIDMEEILDGDECKWQLPVSPHQLFISRYPGRRILDWGIKVNTNINRRTSNNLAVLEIGNCKKLKYLPPLMCLPNLRYLILRDLMKLDYVQEEEDNESIHNNTSSSIFFPRLEKLTLCKLPKVKGWWRRVAATPPEFPLLSKLCLSYCPELELKSFPLCPHLRELDLCSVDDYEVIQEKWPSTIFGCSSSVSLSSLDSIERISIGNCKWLGSFHDGGLASLRCLDIWGCKSLKSVHLESPYLQKITIWICDELKSMELQVEEPTTSLRSLEIACNKQLKKLHIPAAHLNALEELAISECLELKLWRECHLDWDSLTNLCYLILEPLPPPEKIPNCLRQRHALGQLTIMGRFYGENIKFDFNNESE